MVSIKKRIFYNDYTADKIIEILYYFKTDQIKDVSGLSNHLSTNIYLQLNDYTFFGNYVEDANILN